MDSNGMRINFDGEMFRASRVTGPRHNYLGMVVLLVADADDWPLIEHAHGNEPRSIESHDIRTWICEGVRKANEALSTEYRIGRAEYVISDSNDPAIYRAMAKNIVLTAHSSPKTEEGGEGA
jgi:hypothetical protein